MTEIYYRLHDADGSGIEAAEPIDSPEVPRLGELVDIENRSYQVIDVLWHHRRTGATWVTVTAGELSWHEHIARAEEAWRRRS